MVDVVADQLVAITLPLPMTRCTLQDRWAVVVALELMDEEAEGEVEKLLHTKLNFATVNY